MLVEVSDQEGGREGREERGEGGRGGGGGGEQLENYCRPALPTDHKIWAEQ